MNHKQDKIQNLSANDSLFLELVEHLILPESSKLWLQKIVNLLKQCLGLRNVAICTYLDNLIVFALDDPDFLQSCESVQIHNNDKEGRPYWKGENYYVPLSFDALLVLHWANKPSESQISSFNSLFSIISASLKNRTDLLLRESNISCEESIFRIQNLLNETDDLKEKIKLVAGDLLAFLGVSRCQIKIFSQLSSFSYENNLSVELTSSNFIESISVVPFIEQQWLQEIQSGKNVVLVQSQRTDVENIDSLLSVKSFLAYPLRYKNKTVGTLVLHQCDYEREWKTEELSYLAKVSFLLGVVIGAEIEIEKKHAESITDLNTGLINSERLLRELNRLQCEAQIKGSTFSLIMVDIEKLQDINLKMGFVAGNLVLSQTARYLKRFFGEQLVITRYSNDEFVIILNDADHNSAHLKADQLKDYLSNVSVLGIGTVEYNFSFVTYPTHSASVSELLVLLEQAMILSKSRGKYQVSSFDEIKGQPKANWHQLVTNAIPEIIVKKTSLKTGPEIMETINKQVIEIGQRQAYSADILDSIQSLAIALDSKDSYTEGHSNRVAEYAYLLSKEMGLDLQEIEWIRLAASMHDIGKIGIPENILCKPGKLTKEEYEVMKKHPLIGEKILKPIKPLEKVAKLVLYHHEYWDGSGYPNGLMGRDIPVGARIVSIVDAYQAMTSNRPYRAMLPFEEAINRLKAGKEKQWDPEITELFIKLVSK